MEKVMGLEVTGKELRRRAVRRFSEDVGTVSAAERKVIEDIVRHMYSPDLRSGVRFIGFSRVSIELTGVRFRRTGTPVHVDGEGDGIGGDWEGIAEAGSEEISRGCRDCECGREVDTWTWIRLVISSSKARLEPDEGRVRM